MDAIVSIIPNIKSWFPLVALIVACLAFIIRRAIKKESSLIELASEKERADLVQQHLKARSVNLENLTAEQQYEYAIRDLSGRQRNLTYIFTVALTIIILSSFIVYWQSNSDVSFDPTNQGLNEFNNTSPSSRNSSLMKNSPKPKGHSSSSNSKSIESHTVVETRPPRPEDFAPGERPPRPEDFAPGERPPRPEDFAPGERPSRSEDFDEEKNHYKKKERNNNQKPHSKNNDVKNT